MPEMIDKKRTEAKVFLIARLFIDRPDREVELAKAVIHRCCEEIDKQPAIEAEPVRHGRWNEKGHCKCCGYDMGSRVNKWTNVYNFQFCPNCGAKMDAEGGVENG